MTDLHLRHWGHGPREALLLHCGLGSGATWRGVAEVLAEGFSLTAPDLPGHGRSPGWGTGDVHDQATDAVRPLLRDGMHLVGHSFGATVALRLALEAPEKVAALTLIEPVFFAAARGMPAHDPHRAAEEAFFAICDRGDLLAAAQAFNRLWGGGVPWDRFPLPVQEDMARNMPFVRATEPGFWHDCHGMLAEGVMEGLHVPVTLVRGSATVPIIADVHRGLMARLPQVAETVVAGAGHMLVLTHPEAVADAVQQGCPVG